VFCYVWYKYLNFWFEYGDLNFQSMKFPLSISHIFKWRRLDPCEFTLWEPCVMLTKEHTHKHLLILCLGDTAHSPCFFLTNLCRNRGSEMKYVELEEVDGAGKRGDRQGCRTEEHPHDPPPETGWFKILTFGCVRTCFVSATSCLFV